MPDYSELICWTEEPELISTISKKDKKEIIKAIGDADEVHGESFPTLSPIPEDEPLESGPQRRRRQEEEQDDQDTITDQNIQQVAGEEDTHEAEEANEEPDVDNSDGEPPPPDFTPTTQQKRDLQVAHENCGHPTSKDFAKLLRRGNCKPDIANWVAKHFVCPECESNKRPKSRRPTAVPKTFRFNHVVGIDLVEKKYNGQAYFWLNAICWGTGLQMVYPLTGDGTKEPRVVWETFVDSWQRIFGMPEMIVMDPGTEFKAHFAEQCNGHGGIVLPTDPRAPWQNGRTERAGKEWKLQFNLAIQKEAPQDYREWRTLGLLCCAARNQYQNRSGFSPFQRVFGMSMRLPGSLLSDDAIDPFYMYDDPTTQFHRDAELRQAATRAWAATDSRARIKKALSARPAKQESFTEGDVIFVWRQPKVGAGKWVGPGVVILPTSGGAWVNMRGSLWRCANCQMRSATREESLGAKSSTDTSQT